MRTRRPESPRRAAGGSRGQGAVELVALLPLLALVVAVAWQLIVVAHTGWAVAGAAHAAARAHALGADPARAARARLPAGLRAAAAVTPSADGTVRVAVEIPQVLPAPSLGALSASSAFEGGG